jgi:hypothetical protein
MPHRLAPKPGADYLAPTEIVERVRGEFGYADADIEAGADHVGDMIEHLLRIKAGYARWKNPPPESAELDGAISRLGAVRQDAIMLTFGDDPASEFAYVNLAVLPNEPLIIGYCCGQHEDEAKPLLTRFASALGYDISD